MISEKNKKIVQPKSSQGALFALLSVSIFFSLGFYIYFMGLSVLNIVERGSIEKTTTSLSSRVAFLEEEYMKRSKDITPETAKTLGFSAPVHVSYGSGRAFVASALVPLR